MTFSEFIRVLTIVARHGLRAPLDPSQSREFFGSVARYCLLRDDFLQAVADIPEVRLEQLFPAAGRSPICVTVRHDEHSLPYGEAYVLAAIVKQIKPRRVFEFGTWKGASTLVIAQSSPSDCEITSLDLGDQISTLRLPVLEGDGYETVLRMPSIIGEMFRGTKFESKIRLLSGDSADLDVAPYRRAMDMVFIDGSHSYEYALHDSRLALEMAKMGGVLVWDDCSNFFPSVARALADINREVRVRRIAGTRLAICMLS